MKLYTRIAKTLSLLLMGSGQEVLFQFLSVFVWIRAWGVDLYSEWLLLWMLPNLIIRGNLGVFHSAASTLINSFTKNDLTNVAKVYSALGDAEMILVAFIACLIFVVTTALLYTHYLTFFPNTTLIIVNVLLLLQMALFLRQQQMLCLLKAVQKTAKAVLWQNSFRLSIIIPMLVLPIFFQPVVALLVTVLLQILMVKLTGIYVAPIRKSLPVIEDKKDRQAIKKLLINGLRFSAFPFMQTAIHTVAVWALGTLYGASTGALWHNMRTISRAVLIIAIAGEQSIRWEMSAMNIVDKAEDIKKLMHRGVLLFTGVLLPVTLLMILIGQDVYNLLTAKALVFHPYIYTMLCCGAFAYSLAQLYLSVPFSANLHSKITNQSLIIFGIVLALILPGARMGIFYLAALITIADLAVLMRARAMAYSIFNSFKGNPVGI